MRRILVTGANKGIGLAIVEAILEKEADTFVFLGSRDLERGREAAETLGKKNGAWAARIDVVQLDVSSDDSVVEAAKIVADKLDREKLYGIVNNAGIGSGANGLTDVFAVNTLGVHRVIESFLPLVEESIGRIVNVTSAAGPSFVATCSAEKQRLFVGNETSWEQLRALIDECIVIDGDERAFAAKGLGNGEAYGLSKACTNTYTQIVARKHPELHVNACTPGFIETDMTRKYVLSAGKSAAEMGMKPPSEGAKAPLHLLFGTLEGAGRYYGSDAQRSPLDRYRAPGSAPYKGD